MNIWNFLFGTKKTSQIKIGIPIVISFKREQPGEVSTKIGDLVNLWVRPETNQINAYLKGSIGGQGLVGTTFNDSVNKHLKTIKHHEARIVHVSNTSLEIEIILKDSGIDETRKGQLLAQLQKKYNPNKNWILKFTLLTNARTDKEISIGFNDSNRIAESLDDIRSNIWLENHDGMKISDKNWSHNEDVIKTLRAIYSGHSLDLEFLLKEHDVFYFEVSIR